MWIVQYNDKHAEKIFYRFAVLRLNGVLLRKTKTLKKNPVKVQL